jgi:hypothetical protein
MVPGFARNWIAADAAKQSNLNQNKNRKYDNFTLNKINRPVAFAARFPSHPTRAHLLCAFADRARR